MNRMRKSALQSIPVIVLFCAAARIAGAQDLGFPRQYDAAGGTLTMYQPQPESLKGNLLSGRAAVQVKLSGIADPVFGALWFTARIDTDEETRAVTARDIRVTKTRWPDMDPEQEARLNEVVHAAVPDITIPTSMERLSASLGDVEREQQSVEQLRNEPPKIAFENQLAVLLLYDGEPRLSPVEDTAYERALNTPLAVVRDTRSGTCFLTSGKLYYTAPDPLGPWTPIEQPPADLVQILPKDDSDSPVPATPPKIVVATEPTELIATEGEPRWSSLADGSLLYAENTETPWIRELATQQMYILISGRWYRATSTSGPWEFVRPDQLPEVFKKIPPGSDIAGVRVSVSGTEEASEALLDAQIPQTAAISRKEAKFEAEYDGEPQFEEIPGTRVSYAVNTGGQILLIGGRYYAVDAGVWFVGTTPSGPWIVADEVPEAEIRLIPPSAPVYNVTYVHIYEATPELVYVGYTAGYRWSFGYYGVPVYGTGYYYRPYTSMSYYYPRPITYGLHVGYNPWSGWNFGMSWYVGFLHFGSHWDGGWSHHHHRYRPWHGCGGWYGGHGPGWGGWYGHHNVIGAGAVHIGGNVNFGNRRRIWNEIRLNPRVDARSLRRENLYTRPENRMRNAEVVVIKGKGRARRAVGVQNNVLVDRDGNVMRKTQRGWETRENRKWQVVGTGGDTKTATAQGKGKKGSGQKTTTVGTKESRKLDSLSVQRDFKARQRGQQRETVSSEVRHKASQSKSVQQGGGSKGKATQHEAGKTKSTQQGKDAGQTKSTGSGKGSSHKKPH